MSSLSRCRHRDAARSREPRLRPRGSSDLSEVGEDLRASRGGRDASSWDEAPPGGGRRSGARCARERSGDGGRGGSGRRAGSAAPFDRARVRVHPQGPALDRGGSGELAASRERIRRLRHAGGRAGDLTASSAQLSRGGRPGARRGDPAGPATAERSASDRLSESPRLVPRHSSERQQEGRRRRGDGSSISTTTTPAGPLRPG